MAEGLAYPRYMVVSLKQSFITKRMLSNKTQLTNVWGKGFICTLQILLSFQPGSHTHHMLRATQLPPPLPLPLPPHLPQQSSTWLGGDKKQL